jgi:hypothetical protein
MRRLISGVLLLAPLTGAQAQGLSPRLIPGLAPDTAQQKPGVMLPCPDCNPPKRFWAGAGELMLAQLLPWSLNHFVKGAEWADISPSTWWTNMSNPWQWDNNKFLNNQFSHPYHGNLYFNAARTNGYSFWTSAPWSLGGSLMWELYGESWAPAPNDLLNTTLGGITLGEMLYRLSSLTLDNTATGAERTFREIGATLLDPIRGFNRLVRGETNDHVANPEDWRPSRIWTSIDAGYRNSSGTSTLAGPGSLNQGSALLQLFYGDQVEDVTKKPFSAFTVTAELASNNKLPGVAGGTLAQLRARGNLGGWQLKDEPGTSHSLAGFMRYEYQTSPAFEFGGQGFNFGLISRLGDTQGFRIYAEVLGDFMPIAAIRSDHYTTIEGRDYDYGVGLGGSAEARAVWPGRAVIRANARFLYEPVISGFDGGHTQNTLFTEGRYYLGGRVGIGASYAWYHRHSYYDAYPDVSASATIARVFLSYTFPKWSDQ